MTQPVNHRPFGRLDAQGRIIPSSFTDLAYRGDNTSGATLIYVGYAHPGAATSAAVWQIRKQAWDASTPPNLVSVTWPQDALAHASNDYNFVWDNRASYTYS